MSKLGTKFFWRDNPKNFLVQNVHLVPIRWIPKRFSKFGFFIVEICILVWDFLVIFENYCMPMLSIRGNKFIAYWAYEETISSHTEHKPNEFSLMLSQRKNVNSFYMYSYAEHTGKWFDRTLSIQGNDLNAGWAYEEIISWLTEHSRKCLKLNISAESNMIFKNLVLQALWVIRIRFLQKSNTKISCLCTFKGTVSQDLWLQVLHESPSPDP